MYDSKFGCPILPAEVKSITQQFEVKFDGNVDYKRFLLFARRQKRPCDVHNR